MGLDEAGTDDLFALFEMADGATWGTPVLHGVEGAFVLVPPLPDDPYAGGGVELRLTDGTDIGAVSVEELRTDLLPLKIAQMLTDDGTSNSVAGELAGLDPDSADLLADMLTASGFAEPLGEDVLVEQIAAAEADLETQDES